VKNKFGGEMGVFCLKLKNNERKMLMLKNGKYTTAESKTALLMTVEEIEKMEKIPITASLCRRWVSTAACFGIT